MSRLLFPPDHVRTASEARAAAVAAMAWRRSLYPLRQPAPVAPPPRPRPRPVPKPATQHPIPLMPREIRRIIQASAEHFGVEISDMLCPSRMRVLVAPRHVCMWLLRERGLSFPQIARRMNRGDHTTAIHGVRAV